MHSLEHALMLMSKRVASGEESPRKLAADILELAGISASYIPEDLGHPGHPDDFGATLNDRWSRKYRHLMDPRRRHDDR